MTGPLHVDPLAAREARDGEADTLRQAFDAFRRSVEPDVPAFLESQAKLDRLLGVTGHAPEDAGICPGCLGGVARWNGGTPTCENDECDADVEAELLRWEANEVETSTGKLRRLDVARMVREHPPEVPWVVEGLVARGMLTVLNGKEGEGKSLLATALAAGVATGQTEAGLACEKGRALIVDAENGEHEIHRRVKTLELPGDGIEVFEAQGFDLRGDMSELESVLEDHRPDLLVLDSYRSLWGGQENDAGEVAAVLDPLRNLVRRLDAGALLLHHSGKGTGAYRGSSAIGASAELGFKLAREDGDADPDRAYVETWKCRPARKPPRRWLRLTVDGSSVYIDQAEAPDGDGDQAPAPAAPVQDALAPKVLATLRADTQSRADIARAVGRAPKDRSVGRVLDSLLAEGKAEKVEGTPGSPVGWRGVAGSATPIGTATLPPPTGPRIPEPETGGGRGGGSPASDPRSEPPSDGGLCTCRNPARQPRADGSDICLICKRPMAEQEATS